MSNQPFAQGHGGGGGGRSRRAEPAAPGPRPEDTPDKHVSLRRIGRLFIPYRVRLGGLLGLIVLGSVLSVASPFLLREAINKGIIRHDLTLLSWLVGGMIAMAVINGAISVVQSWISNQVGQRVMHDLRARGVRASAALSLAFFTRTRTGEVQSRIANDIGGVDNVLTSPRPRRCRRSTTVIGDDRGDVPAQLGADALLAAPAAGLRVADARSATSGAHHDRCSQESSRGHLVAGPGVAVGLGDPARQDDGSLHELADRFESGESERLADLEVRARMAGRWRMASMQMTFAIMPAAVYWFGGFEQSPTRRTRPRSSDARRVHDAADAAVRADRQPASASGVDVQSSLALFDASSSTSTCRSTSSSADARTLRTCAATSSSTTCGFATTRTAPGRSQEVGAEIPAGTRTALVGETGSGKTTLAYLVSRLYEPQRGRCGSTASTSAT